MTVSVDLKGWQACLAIDQNRLSQNKPFKIAESGEILSKTHRLIAEVDGFGIQVLEHGKQLVQINCPFSGQLRNEKGITSFFWVSNRLSGKAQK